MPQKQTCNLKPEEILRKFATDSNGLAELEAKKRLKVYGLNKIVKKQNWKWAKLVVNQFNDALVWILLAAAILAFFFKNIAIPR